MTAIDYGRYYGYPLHLSIATDYSGLGSALLSPRSKVQASNSEQYLGVQLSL